MGTGFPIDNAVKLGAYMLEEAGNETRFLSLEIFKHYCHYLEQSTITDVRIEDATIEDELMAYFNKFGGCDGSDSFCLVTGMTL